MKFHTTEPPFYFRAGNRPLLISMPHVGTHVPEQLASRFTEEARRIPDTDWHLQILYNFADELGASFLVATHSRYVVDLNRPPDNQNLYPGQDTTGLCPVDTFDKTLIYWQPEFAPDEEEIAQRRESIWKPYHHQLAAELARLQATFGSVVLWDAHSIRSVLPRFFDGRLPDLNLGTANGTSCAPALADALLKIASEDAEHTAVLNRRFKGGHITRQYGNPGNGIHAVQLEMSQRIYMNETHPFAYRADLASCIQPKLRRMLQTALDFVENPVGTGEEA